MRLRTDAHRSLILISGEVDEQRERNKSNVRLERGESASRIGGRARKEATVGSHTHLCTHEYTLKSIMCTPIGHDT